MLITWLQTYNAIQLIHYLKNKKQKKFLLKGEDGSKTPLKSKARAIGQHWYTLDYLK